MERDCIRQATDLSGDHVHGAKFTHASGRAKNYAVKKAPADVGQRYSQEYLPPAGAEDQGCFFLFAALGLHQWNHFTGDKRHSHEHRGENDPRNGENDLNVAIREPLTEPTLQTEEKNKNESGDHGRYRERNID